MGVATAGPVRGEKGDVMAPLAKKGVPKKGKVPPKKGKAQQDIIGPFVSPSVVRTDIKKTKAFVQSLSVEIVDAFGKSGESLTEEQKQFFSEYAEWRDRFEAWAKENLNETWTPFQVLATSAIATQNDSWRKEAEEKQAKFKGLGFKSKATTPGPSTGQGTGPELGGFLSGMGAGTALALLLVAYLWSEGKGGRR